MKKATLLAATMILLALSTAAAIKVTPKPVTTSTDKPHQIDMRPFTPIPWG